VTLRGVPLFGCGGLQTFSYLSSGGAYAGGCYLAAHKLSVGPVLFRLSPLSWGDGFGLGWVLLGRPVGSGRIIVAGHSFMTLSTFLLLLSFPLLFSSPPFFSFFFSSSLPFLSLLTRRLIVVWLRFSLFPPHLAYCFRAVGHLRFFGFFINVRVAFFSFFRSRPVQAFHGGLLSAPPCL